MTEHDPTDPTSLPILGGVASPPQEPPATPRPAARNLAGPIDARQPTQQVPSPQAPQQVPARLRRQDPPSIVPRKALAPSSGIDWQYVATLRSQASDQLTAALRTERGEDTEAERELGRAIIQELLQAEASERLSSGEPAWSLQEQDAMAQAVFDALFEYGRLQPLLEDDTTENVIIIGCDVVWADKTDGSKVRLDPVADSDDELVEFLQFLDSRSGNPRNFSPARPRLHMKLGGDARLAATAWVTERPTVVIRRHSLRTVTLRDQVERNMVSPIMSSFLSAAVKAGLSIVVAGPQGGGKTTLARALCLEIPEHELVGTFETEYELFLHKLRGLVIPWEERPGSGEFLPDGRQAGAFTLDQALYDSFRFFLSRQIVGEVRGFEVWPMIKAMESGTGSISTTHGASAADTVQKLISCATELGFVTSEVATNKLARNLDLVVQVHMENAATPEGFSRRRWVSEIVAVEPGEKETGYALTHVFKPDRAGGPGVSGTIPDALAAMLEAHGFDMQGYLEHDGGLEGEVRST